MPKKDYSQSIYKDQRALFLDKSWISTALIFFFTDD